MEILEYLKKPITELQELLATGALTSESLVDTYLERIESQNGGERGVNAVLEINPDVRFLAAAADLERKEQGALSPLHGIPILLKDNIDTGDGMHTSAGSLALANSYARKDAFLVQRLRAAGAVILGKANMTEWANFLTRGMPNGYSSRGGQVRNPYGNHLDVGGSSSGSAAAVAAQFAPLAVGTETSGSILNPATNNSVVGLKPTVGAISRAGIIPISLSQDTAGPLGLHVQDVALLFSLMTGRDVNDPATLMQPVWYPHSLSTLEWSQDSLRGKRFGVPRAYYFDEVSPEARKIFESSLLLLKDLGAVLVDPVDIPKAKEIDADSDVLIYEFKPSLNRYLQALPDTVPVHSLKEVIRYNEKHQEQMLRYGQTLFLRSENCGGTLAEQEYLEARRRDLRWTRTEGIDAVLQKYELDALLFCGDVGSNVAAKAGYPSITVPAGYEANGQPVSLTFTSTAFTEPELLQFAFAFEQAAPCHVLPGSLTKV